MAGVSLVGAELLFFALAFYVFWFREPTQKPYKIRGNPWGNYSSTVSSATRTKKSHQYFTIE
jgi:hypothetical protein